MSTKLICIDTKPLQIDAGYNLGLELGKEYELFGVHKCKLTKFDVGIPHPSLHHYTRIQCAECRQLFPNRNIHFYSWRFIKLDPDMKYSEFDEQFEMQREHDQRKRNQLEREVKQTFRDVIQHKGWNMI